MGRKRIGELLVARGVISPAQLEQGLAHQRTTRTRLGAALIERGFLSEEQLCRALAEALAIPQVDLRTETIDWTAVHLLRARFCESNELFPYAFLDGRNRRQLLVAMADPLNVPAIEEIEFTTGMKVSPRLAPQSALRSAIMRYHHKVAPAEDAPDGMMTLIQRGGGARLVDTETRAVAPPSEEEVIEGEDLSLEPTLPRAAPLGSDLAKDLDYLFGGKGEGEDPVEELERKFWALMRAVEKKGLITREDFLRELGED